MDEENEDYGKVDTTSILYIAGGIPAIVGFLVVLFVFVHACNISG